MLWSLLVLLACLGFGAEKDQEERIDAAIQNPALRDYFRERVTDMNTVTDPVGRRRTTFSFPLEDQIDRMARIFLKKLLRALEEARSQQEMTRQLGEQMLGAADPLQRSRQSVDWRLSLRRLSDRVDDLRAEVRPVLSMAHGKSQNKSVAALPDLSTPAGFEREIGELDVDLTRALEATESFFFEASHTVTVSALAEADILVLLERIEARLGSLANRL